VKTAAAMVVTAVGLGCGFPAEKPSDLAGTLLPRAVPRPEFELTTTAGQRFSFREATRGRLTLLFFGYTNCPDVCPATMANLGAVMSRLTSDDRQRIDVVFVTTDPERDPPSRIVEWLAPFDREIIGLTGTVAELEAAQRAAGVVPAIRDTAAGNYAVSHAAQVIVYSPDDSAHVAYPFGVRQQQWAGDLPTLLRRWGGKSR
jgi:protein SCO1/2